MYYYVCIHRIDGQLCLKKMRSRRGTCEGRMKCARCGTKGKFVRQEYYEKLRDEGKLDKLNG